MSTDPKRLEPLARRLAECISSYSRELKEAGEPGLKNGEVLEVFVAILESIGASVQLLDSTGPRS